MDPLTLTPEHVARQLVEKHEKAIKVIQKEFNKYSALENQLEKTSETTKIERDKLNAQVQDFKAERQKYYSDSRALRKDFLEQTKKKDKEIDIPMEVLILTKQIDQLEWEIQTEAVDVDTEKKLVKQIQENLKKLHNYANMYKDHEAVSKAVRKLSAKLNTKLKQAEIKHEKMIKAVAKSDNYHKQFVEMVIKLRDARAKRIGFQHDLKKQTTALEHWKKIAVKEAKNSHKPDKKTNEKKPKLDQKNDQKQKDTNSETVSQKRTESKDNIGSELQPSPPPAKVPAKGTIRTKEGAQDGQ